MSFLLGFFMIFVILFWMESLKFGQLEISLTNVKSKGLFVNIFFFGNKTLPIQSNFGIFGLKFTCLISSKF